MATNNLLFTVEIINKPFKITSDTQSEKTAKVCHLDVNRNVLQEKEYGYVEKENIYELIKTDQPVVLDNCYIKNFSLSEYRDLNGKNANEQVELSVFSATNTFFDSTNTIDFSNASFHAGTIKFTNSLFANGSLNFSKCKFNDCEIDFSNVFFGKGYMNFQFSEFGNGNISFENAEFNGGNISFVNTNFGDGNVIFKNASFGTGNVEFHFAKFKNGNKSFDRATFEGKKIDFRKVEFGDGKVDFRRCEFGNGEVTFDESDFGACKISYKRTKFGDGGVSFNMTNFGDNAVTFEESDFGQGNISFLDAQVRKLTFTACQFNKYVDLRVKKANYIDLSNTIVRDILDLQPGVTDVKIDQINLSGMRNLGRILVEWKKNRVYDIIMEQDESSLDQKAEQFRIIKEEFRQSGQYNDEDKAYIEFKRLELKAWKEEKIKQNKWNALWVYPSMWSEWLLFDLMGLYATDPLRVLISTFVVYVFFSLLFWMMPFFMDTAIVSSLGDPDKLSSFEVSFYHSAITFLTIGYGDYYPSGFFRWLSNIEGFVGVFFMSYFVVAFVRKILR